MKKARNKRGTGEDDSARAGFDEDEGVLFKEKGKKTRKGPRRQREKRTSREWGWIVWLAVGGILGAAGAACLLVAFLGIDIKKADLKFPKIPSGAEEKAVAAYSPLTGEALTDAALAKAPAYCVQIPNGTDGARPQAGLQQAGVVFEAIAEAGITRFAAIYQNPTSGVIGPVRSLRTYYLEWDTPFDCTIVHAGGAPDALVAVGNGEYKNLDEDYAYMYRGTYGVRLWNNLFTTAENLQRFTSDYGYSQSDVKGFARMTPKEAERARIETLAGERLDITRAATGDTSVLSPKVSQIALGLGGWANFNVEYAYDFTTNRYLRGYASGVAHEVYDCPAGNIGEVNPEDACELSQVAPAVVIAMVVREGRAADNYHEVIQTTGEGEVYIFQNGGATHGRWVKESKYEQIKFLDDSGAEIKLIPGQTFVTAVPDYGAVDFF